ncbi:hypothetical protein [Planomicrobium sp. CPCC 101079]|uniref:hypothetical protein n=1 Tax=Planomicrobium sp. CPCC 101079 TaxID=2599618 RepID=UPI0011B5EF94|nr:hypothetical protein [Planomicrobium sp. CPCC 101079]TWT01586.1 hypothetical protein FQV28_16070 [Planomicrobium sp. CPCC 101079]
MKRIARIFYFHAVLVLLAGCTGNTDEESAKGSSEGSSASEPVEKETEETTSTSEGEEAEMNKENEVPSEETVATDAESTTSSDSKGEESSSQYSSEEIEYARVWLQLGANQEIDGLYVQHIPAGEPLNPDDETSGTYPEDVIQLAGSRLVDGSVTYSGNGDGTINVYNVPLRWDGEYPAGKEFYEEIIDNTELVSVDTGDDQEVIRLIKLLNIES